MVLTLAPFFLEKITLQRGSIEFLFAKDYQITAEVVKPSATFYYGRDSSREKGMQIVAGAVNFYSIDLFVWVLGGYFIGNFREKKTLAAQDSPENRNLVSLLVQNSDLEKKNLSESERYLWEGVIKKKIQAHTIILSIFSKTTS